MTPDEWVAAAMLAVSAAVSIALTIRDRKRRRDDAQARRVIAALDRRRRADAEIEAWLVSLAWDRHVADALSLADPDRAECEAIWRASEAKS